LRRDEGVAMAVNLSETNDGAIAGLIVAWLYNALSF
jgi:hypothetical protein